MNSATLGRRPLSLRLASFFVMMKLRVNALIVFTAMIGMFLADPGLPPLGVFIGASLGIALVSGAAAAFNCVLEQHIDGRMARTRARPLPMGQAAPGETLVLAALVGCIGLALLWHYANPLTMALTFATFIGYAIIYTVILKPATPMNIVIGGAAGAMPPVLGWAALHNTVAPEALVLFLIIFIWTPPHFWSLACYRRDEYARAGLPMLPVTHGLGVTCLHILGYTVMLAAASLLPVTIGLSGPIYLATALVLNAGFLGYAWAMQRRYSDALARKAFRFSILYLTVLFAALLVDHYLTPGF